MVAAVPVVWRYGWLHCRGKHLKRLGCTHALHLHPTSGKPALVHGLHLAVVVAHGVRLTPNKLGLCKPALRTEGWQGVQGVQASTVCVCVGGGGRGGDEQ